MFAVLKASLPRQLKCTERRRIISVIGIAAIVAKQLKSTVFVYAGMCYEVISVYGFKIEWMGTASDSRKTVVTPFFTEVFNVADVISVGNSGNDKNRVCNIHVFIDVLDAAELPYLLGIRLSHFPFDLDIQVRRASSVATVKQKVG